MCSATARHKLMFNACGGYESKPFHSQIPLDRGANVQQPQELSRIAHLSVVLLQEKVPEDDEALSCAIHEGKSPGQKDLR
jgi:hypothetical protein